MEDAATAEIARVQVWQWCHWKATTSSGQPITPEYVDALVKELSPSVKSLVGGVSDEHIKIAGEYLKGQVRQEWPSDFLTSDLMPLLEKVDGAKWVRSAL